MYVTIDSVMLQVQRYLHVNRQKKKETFARTGKFFLEEKAAVMQHMVKCTEVLDKPSSGWLWRNVDRLGHLTDVNFENTQKYIKIKKLKMALI